MSITCGRFATRWLCILLLVQQPIRPGPLSRFVTIHNIVIKHDMLTYEAVISVYSKDGGKHGKHSLASQLPVLISASNIAVTVFQHHFGRRFDHHCQ